MSYLQARSWRLTPAELPVRLCSFIVWALCGVLLIGCGKADAPPPPPAPSISAIAAAPTNVESSPAHASEESSADEAEQSGGQDALAEPAAEPPTSERIVLLLPAGPLLVDVRINIAGRPHTAVFDELLARVIQAADTDGDGRATWSELAANREFLESASANMPAADTRQMKSLIERLDENRDGRIQPAEAAAWLGREAGVAVRAFAVRSSRSYSPIPRATSRVWQLLDADRNGRLSRAEIEAGPDRLWSLDGDDDRAITPAELASLREQLEAAAPMQRAGREPGRYAALHLQPEVDAERLDYLLTDLYAPRQVLQRASFPGMGDLFDRLDANGDGWLALDELAAMAATPPHLELLIAFEDGPSARTLLRVEKHAAELEPAAQTSVDRLIVRARGTRLIFSAHDLSPPAAAEQTPAQVFGAETVRAQIRLMVHDQLDAIFGELDANGDGRLGEREINQLASLLLARDSDGDAQLAGEELPYSLVVACLRAEAANRQNFYVPLSTTPAAPGADVPDWFQYADFNGDGDVSRREFVGSADQFARLDADQDGYISLAEATAHVSREQTAPQP